MKTPLMKTRLGKKLHNESGQALIITLLCLTLLLGFVGLAADVGTLFYAKRQLQAAADSAALAAASDVTFPTLYTQAALNDAATNGAVNGSNGVTVAVNCPPLQGPHAGGLCSNYVEVVISQTQKTLFMSLFSPNPATVAARAVGYLKNSAGCLFALNGTNGATPANVAGAFNMAGTFVVIFQAPTCAMYVDSSNAQAVASGAIDFVTVKSMGIVGGFKPGFFNWTCNGGPPCPATGIVPVSDPLSYLTPPPNGVCSGSHTNLGSAANPITATNPVTLNWILQPGTYCGTLVGGVPNAAINMTSVPHALTFNPGTYVIDGGGASNAGAPASGGLYISGSSGVTANGVTFYLHDGASFNIAPNLVGSFAGVTLTAPSSGPYSGILFYQDRADTSPAYLGNVLSFIHLEGALYLPVANLSFPSVISGTYSHYAIYVANTFTFQALLGIFQDYANAPSNGSGKSPIETVVLVE